MNCEVPAVTLRVHSRLPVSFAVASLNPCLIWSYTASLVLRPLSPQRRTQAAAHLPQAIKIVLRYVCLGFTAMANRQDSRFPRSLMLLRQVLLL